MKCLILAAGKGKRLSHKGDSKPLVPVLGVSLIAQLASIIDGCDGEIARLKYMESSFGGWFDAVLDRYADAFLLFGLTWHDYVERTASSTLIAGFLAITGSFMISYTANKYGGLMRARIQKGKRIRIGRDMRMLIIFIGALLNQVFVTLLILAVLTNAETVRRILVCRRHE